MITSINNAEHYTWGDQCDGWHLLKSPSLSVIQEKMPPLTGEQLHYHSKAQQLFYILSGTATFEVKGEAIIAEANQSIHIMPGIKHRILNNGDTDLHFLVISEPKAHGDRINLQ
ncbi:cupin domain-containing protein [Mucilaginibacter xinganensis]|uniref:Cupin n=1 Tax=Mucilaginibacter xinganensis TaxID=1234841 RepID=A0A223NQ39_9SPHI|nr:cupin domain-containing protein [Mucilaginibacter xinganensis]ASU32035.1 cupin [Mucilaginibacter xinganensis]